MKFDLMEIGKYYIIENPVDDGPGIYFIFIKNKGFNNKKYFIICDIYETILNYRGIKCITQVIEYAT